ncbi:MAG: thiamine diphosphokinase [Schwartzia sp.]|nr:thiamine diphosphokinase [Schwartzia sp. (in: firmicutes)]
MKLKLPQLTAELSLLTSCTDGILVLAAGGRPPHSSWLQQTVSDTSALWAVDRGIDACRLAGLVPHRLIGDADSATGESWQWAEQHDVPIDRYAPAKDLTDFQLALELSRSDFFHCFILAVGAFGGRLDHALSLLYSLVGDGRPGCMADQQEVLLLIRGGESAEIMLHEEAAEELSAVSLLPLSSACTGVSLSGVRWPLENAEITQKLPYAVSNELLPGTKKISVSLTDGVMGFYMMFGKLEA